SNNFTQDYYVYGPPENNWMCIHFSQINTESGYDYVYVYDNDGTLLNTYSGSYGATWSAWGDGPTFRVRIVTDGSITGYGFDVDYIQVGGPCLYQNSQHPYQPNTNEYIDMYGPTNDWLGEVCFYYDSIHTEPNYDTVFCYDLNNTTILNIWSGQYDNVWSNWSTYNSSFTTQLHERSRLKSDGSVQYYGWLVNYFNFFREHRVESAHNYPNSINQTYYVYGPQDQGSIQMRVHFAKLNTESGYDYVYVYDANGNLLNSYSGDYGTNFWSNWGQGNYIRVVLTTDASVQRWGFKIDQYEWVSAAGQPNLTYYTPSGWDYPIVPSSVAGTHTVGPNLQGGATTYIDWAIINNGTATARPTFYTYLYSDNVPIGGWYTDSLPPNWYAYVEDWTYTFTAGDHTLMTFADSTNVVAESNESDNKYSRTFTWGSGGGTLGWDHVIITNNTLKPNWANFRSFIRSTYGITDTVVTTEYIYANYSGVDNQTKIRNFIIDAVNNHSTQYILLGGDVDIVPYRKTFSGVVSGYGGWYDTIPCDLYYADLQGNWDGNGNGTYGEPGDNVDMYPDVWLGRATVGSSTDITRFTNRFQNYYSTTSHQTNILLTGFDLDANTHGETTLEQYYNTLPTGYIKKRVYDTHGGNHADTTRTALNNGQNIWFHIDHGSETWMGIGYVNHNWGFGNTDMDNLTNQPEYTIFTSIACLIGAFDVSDCITEHFVNAASGGGVCAMTNSRFGWFISGQNPQTQYSADFMNHIFNKLFSHSPGRGYDFHLGKADLIATANSNNWYRWSMYALNLFGDPIQTIHIPYTTVIEDKEISSPEVNHGSDRVLVSPNPFTNSPIVYINLNYSGPITVELFDIMGRKMYSRPIDYSPKMNAYNLKNLIDRKIANGVYYLIIKTEKGEKIVEKIVKTK
ncbi:MAG: C25 family cysteine peptidase, partial [candidate division WOR-3 bacterium]